MQFLRDNRLDARCGQSFDKVFPDTTDVRSKSLHGSESCGLDHIVHSAAQSQMPGTSVKAGWP